MNKTALITGASVGIGYELSKVFARNGYNLVLISRTKKKLEANAEELENKHSIQAKVIPKDLSISSAPQELYDEIAADGIEITVLVNNAGFGLNGKFVDISTDRQTELIQLNMTTLTVLCKLFGTDMCYQGLESATKSGFKKYNDDNKDAVIYIGFNVNPHPYC